MRRGQRGEIENAVMYLALGAAVIAGLYFRHTEKMATLECPCPCEVAETEEAK